MINPFAAREGRLVDGVVRTPGRTFQDLRADDPHPGPDDVYSASPLPGGDFTIPNSWYFSEEHEALEREKLWPNVWVWACRIEHLPEPGSCYVHDFLDDSVLIVRTAEDELRAYRNTCPHRGTQLKESGFCGRVGNFVCPYHGAAWKNDGTLLRWPFRYEFPTVTDDSHALSEVAVGEFQGFIFVNTSDDPIPFEDYIEPLPRMLRESPWDRRHPVLHMKKKLRCNWKIVVQAFHETMHVPVTHSQARPINLTAGSQIDILSDYVSRVINPSGVPGDTVEQDLDERDVLEEVFKLRGLPADEMLAGIPEDVRARNWLAESAAAVMSESLGIDLSGVPTTELVDNINYRLFPNFFLLHGYNLQAAHRHIPGDTPDECYFEVMWFALTPESGETPPLPECIEIGVDEVFSDYADGDIYAVVADQDTANMERQQKGLRASPKGRSIFGNYLESGIVHDLRLMTRMYGLDDEPMASPTSGQGES